MGTYSVKTGYKIVNKCCGDQKPVNIGMLREKWICKSCDADLEPTDKQWEFSKIQKDVDVSNYYDEEDWRLNGIYW